MPEAATTALNNNYKCYAAPGDEPRVAFIVRNSVVPHVFEMLYSPNGLAGHEDLSNSVFLDPLHASS